MKRAVPTTLLWPGVTLWLIITSLFLFFSLRLTYLNHLFAVESRPVSGFVTDKYVVVSHGRGTSTTYYVTYQYQAGPLIEACRTSTQLATYNALETGQSVPIKYLADHPGMSRIALSPEDQSEFILATFGDVAGLISLVAGSAILRSLSLRNRRYADLIDRGLSCLGQVTGLGTEPYGKGGTRTYLIVGFRDEAGREIEGRTWGLAPAVANLWREGNPIRIYYDRNDSSIFTVDVDGSTLRRDPLPVVVR